MRVVVPSVELRSKRMTLRRLRSRNWSRRMEKGYTLERAHAQYMSALKNTIEIDRTGMRTVTK